MKTLHLLPVFAQAQGDDTSTLLSLKVHTSLEVGVDHLLDAVGSRNVTQMSSLLQNLVEESISDGLGQLDGDVKQALALIKKELLGDIRDSLKEAHCISQASLHEKVLCFEKCETAKYIGEASCGRKCDGDSHKKCREELFGYYKDHIKKCRDLDIYVKNIKCDHYDKDCCYLPHTTWNCQGPCKGTISKLHVDDKIGHWMKKQITKYQSIYDIWIKKYEMCKESYRTYIVQDAKCDCLQAECETRNCEWDSCRFINCEVNYQKCWGECEAKICQHYPPEDCKEKDRKIDWAATEKIECYVDVLVANPTKKDLLEKCGTEDCISKWREQAYLDCSKICPEVDFGADNIFPKWGSDDVGGSYDTDKCHTPGDYDGSDYPCIDKITEIIEKMGEHVRRPTKNMVNGEISHDEDLAGEGRHSVSTNHRAKDGNEGGRCTAHLDLDWQKPPCCTPCPVRDSKPCEGGGSYTDGWDKSKYMWFHYGQYGFLDTNEISGFDFDKCWEASGEHTYEYAYNLCPCMDCPDCGTPHCPTCTEKKGCESSCGKKSYDYAPHLLAALKGTPNDKGLRFAGDELHYGTAECYGRDDGDRKGTNELNDMVRDKKNPMKYDWHAENDDVPHIIEKEAKKE